MSAAVPDYTCISYLRATPEQVWDALTDAEATARFWGHSQVSDWQVGSRVDHVRIDGSGVAEVSGRVVEADRPRRLSFGFDETENFDVAGFEPSVVTFDIEPGRGIVRLTVTHSALADLDAYRMVGQGWPAVLSNLKTLLETGEVLPQDPWTFDAG
ncbi:SRPBCC family protein [Saccharopolyspora sp. NPDC047091]|uniref:SRPBCC family protein n=1 Tax=Saccharopolyspora sp. NPDC047091 TaxID=3155924 RepID=UPI0033E33674